MSSAIRIGTRGSALALAQARWVEAQLRQYDPHLGVDLVIIKTTGDRFIDKPLSGIGGKGLFVKEIEDALSAATIDCAVHSMKDVPAYLAAGLTIAAVPPREDARDVLISSAQVPLLQLPRAARVGTSSLRRAALLRSIRPDLSIVTLRGNVDTRLNRLRRGELDAVVLAAAGLRRLGITCEMECLDPREFVPAIGQGALAIESRNDDVAAVLSSLDDPVTRAAVMAERAFMAGVGGSCHTPMAAHAVVLDGQLRLDALIASPDGQQILRASQTASAADGVVLGRELARQLLARGGAKILAALGVSVQRERASSDV